MVRSCRALAVQMTARWTRMMLHCLKAPKAWVLSLTYLMPESKLIGKGTEFFFYWPNFHRWKSVFLCSWFFIYLCFKRMPALSWVSESFRQDIGQFHSPWTKPCDLENFLFIKNISIMKNLTDFHKMDGNRCWSAPEGLLDPGQFPVLVPVRFSNQHHCYYEVALTTNTRSINAAKPTLIVHRLACSIATFNSFALFIQDFSVSP